MKLTIFLTIITCVVNEIIAVPTCNRPGFIPIHQSCYHFSEKAATWSEAGLLCQGMGAKLVSIESPEEALEIHLHILYQMRNSRYWTSGNDLSSSGKYKWASSRKDFQYTEWCPGEPSNEFENCVHIHHNDHKTCWNDLACNANHQATIPMYYICEY